MLQGAGTVNWSCYTVHTCMCSVISAWCGARSYTALYFSFLTSLPHIPISFPNVFPPSTIYLPPCSITYSLPFSHLSLALSPILHHLATVSPPLVTCVSFYPYLPPLTTASSLLCPSSVSPPTPPSSPYFPFLYFALSFFLLHPGRADVSVLWFSCGACLKNVQPGFAQWA